MVKTKDRCGFVLEVNHIRDMYGGLDFFLSLFDEQDPSMWYGQTRMVCCWRPAWDGNDRCIWHAPVDEKPVDDLIASRTEGPERLDGARLNRVDIGDRLSFAGCNLTGADFSGSNLRGTDFSGANLAYANLEGCDIENADLGGAEIFGTLLPEARSPGPRDPVTGSLNENPEGTAINVGPVEQLYESAESSQPALFEQALSRFAALMSGGDVAEEGSSVVELFRRARETELAPGSPEYSYLLLIEAKATQALADHDVDPRENYRRAIDLYRQARDGVDTAPGEHAGLLNEQARCHRGLADLEVDKIRNLHQAIELYERARLEGAGSDSSAYLDSLVEQASLHVRLGELAVDAQQNLERAVDLYDTAIGVGLDTETPLYVKLVSEQANIYTLLAEMGVNIETNLLQAAGRYVSLRETSYPPDTPMYAWTMVSEANQYYRLAMAGINLEANLKRVTELNERARRSGLSEEPFLRAASLRNQASAHIVLAQNQIDIPHSYERAIELYEQVLDSKYSFGDGDSRTLLTLAAAREDLSEFGVDPEANTREAILLCERALTSGLEEGTSDYGFYLHVLALSHIQLGRLNVDSEANLRRAIEISQRARDPILVSDSIYSTFSLVNEANAYVALGELNVDPEASFERTIELSERARADGLEPGTPEYAMTYINQALSHIGLGERGRDPESNFEHARALYELARERGLIEGSRFWAQSLANQATAHRNLGDAGVDMEANFQRSTELNQRAREEGLVAGTPEYASSFVNEANDHLELGYLGFESESHFTQAIDLYERARNLGFEAGMPYYGYALSNQARAHQALGDIDVEPRVNYETAIELFERAREKGLVAGTPTFADTFSGEAAAYSGLSELDIDRRTNRSKAIECYERAREAGSGFSEGSPGYALVEMNEAQTRKELYAEGIDPEINFERAVELFADAAATFEQTGYVTDLARLYKHWGHLYDLSGDERTAYERYKQSIDSVEGARSSVLRSGQRERFFEIQLPVYSEVVRLALTLGETEEAFEYFERAKARQFLELLGNVRISRDIPEDLVNEEQRLLAEIEALWNPDRAAHDRHRRHVKLYLPVDGTFEAEQNIDDQFTWLEAKERELGAVRQKIREINPEAYSLKQVDPQPIEDIRSTLAQDETLLEYYVTESDCGVFILDPAGSDMEYVSLPVEGLELVELVNGFRSAIESIDTVEVRSISQELYERLIAPITELIRENLVIVPHSVLHYLAFPALYDAQTDQYLVETSRLRFAANGSSLVFTTAKKHGNRIDHAFVVGDPTGDLAHAREEARSIAAHYRIPPERCLIGHDAVIDLVRELIEDCELAHLACHGNYVPESPWMSGLHLSDRKLYLQDIFNLRLRAALVTLSACETAHGDVSLGDEIQSLVRGFQYAGAPSVIGSLWNVNDASTRYLFEAFYRREGDFDDRLREAQVAFIRDDRYDDYRHPYYWSGFQLYG